MGSYAYTPFPYIRPPELQGCGGQRRPVVIVGAGPVGLTAAIDLARQGQAVLVLDAEDCVSTGSRAICWAKRTLEIWDRLGIADRMVAKGVTWKTGRLFHGAEQVYSFDLLPEGGHKMPAFINLQQYYVEEYLIDRLRDFAGLAELRWKNTVVGLQNSPSGVHLEIETPDGRYGLQAEWVIAADGARSSIRTMLGLPFEGQTFEERFLIADVRIEQEAGNERKFWFAPPFHAGQSALMHRQPDNVFRIDFQLDADIDPALELQPQRVMARVRAAIGEQIPFELEWCSIYRFRCAKLDRFVHERVIFAGDSAHVVSPFGARGGNGGIQDVDNLCWKLLRVLRGTAPAALLDSYDEERQHGSAENIRHSSRTTRFMTPKTAAERWFRDGVLALAHDFPFARGLVNGGRLSLPCSLAGLSLQTPAEEADGNPMLPGSPCADAPVQDSAGRSGWLLNRLGDRFALLHFAEAGAAMPSVQRLRQLEPEIALLMIAASPTNWPDWTQLIDSEGLVVARYGGRPGMTYLVRPDQHIAACFSTFDEDRLCQALVRASGRATEAVAGRAA